LKTILAPCGSVVGRKLHVSVPDVMLEGGFNTWDLG